jgi:predicted nucleotide-binding protein
VAVFIVHGHDVGKLRDVENFLRRVVGEVIVLGDEPSGGRTIIEKFEAHANRSGFAVVLLTGDDEGRSRGQGELKRRGRQNVVFEMGYFFAHLGRGRTVVLYESGVERPSDIDGLVYISFDDQWAEKLRAELSEAGISLLR